MALQGESAPASVRPLLPSCRKVADTAVRGPFVRYVGDPCVGGFDTGFAPSTNRKTAMPSEANLLSPGEEARRIETEAATEILRMLTSDCLDRTGDGPDGGYQTAQRSLRQETTMWF